MFRSMRFSILKLILSFVFISVFLLPNFLILEGQATENFEEICLIEEIEKSEKTLSKNDYQALLIKCEKYYKEQSEIIEKDLNKTAGEKKTLENTIWSLKNKVKKLENEIYESNLIIKDLGLQIADTKGSIDDISLRIDDSKEELSVILRTIYEEDQRPLIELLLLEDGLSDFFSNLVALEAVGAKNKELLSHIKGLKSYLEGQRQSLDTERGDLENIVVVRSLQKQENASLKKEQENLWWKTEAEYQEYLKEQEETKEAVAEIAARIFRLVGVPDAPTFGEAVQIANLVTDRIKIRTAFLLAIISQESAMGRNVGQCYITDDKKGGGIYKNGNPIDRIIHYTRDLPIFLDITKRLGMDFAKTPVSCWIPNCIKPYSSYFCGASVSSNGSIACYKSGYVPFGFGGAMGPAQFIPSTWKGLEDEIKFYTGSETPNPWNIKDAFTASALYLQDLGAGAQTKTAEANAASRYYGGSSSYARQVANRANCIQDFIDKGIMSSYCNDLIF